MKKFAPPHLSVYSFDHLSFFFQTSAKQSSWEKVKSEAGVEVFEKKINGKVAFRGIGLMEGDPAKLVELENPGCVEGLDR